MVKRTTVIWYDVKEELKLSLSEYVVIDLIKRASPASKGKRSPFACGVRRAVLGEYLGMSKSSLFRIIERLMKKGLLIKPKRFKREFLIVTDKWYNAMEPYKLRDAKNEQSQES